MWSDLTISSITDHLTLSIIEGVRPNCEKAWSRRISGTIAWNVIWKSIGTALSDSTEEKQWRKLLHRAIFVRSKDLSAPTCACRLGCPDTESMLHLFECRHTKPLRTACLDFIKDLGCGRPDKRLHGLIFGQWTDSSLGPPEARALLRHAFRALYRSLTLLEIENRLFV